MDMSSVKCSAYFIYCLDQSANAHNAILVCQTGYSFVKFKRQYSNNGVQPITVFLSSIYSVI
jgi:hypothetical protein